MGYVDNLKMYYTENTANPNMAFGSGEFLSSLKYLELFESQ